MFKKEFLFSVSLSWVSNSLNFYSSSYFFGFMWLMPNISTFFVNYLPVMMSYNLYKNFDQGSNEYLGGQGIYMNLKKSSMTFQFFQNNSMKIYLLLMVLWLIVLFY